MTNSVLIKKIQESFLQTTGRDTDVRTGMEVEVSQKIKE
jgi:hypothetical protein